MPDLENLKKQAKDAQEMVAREHGFDTWQALK
jgi:hypothetical protein